MSQTNGTEEKPRRKLPYELIADRLIEGLEKGDCVFTKPWKAGELVAPVNAVTGKAYQGVNMMHLLEEGKGDPRFCTLRQANEAGWKVRKGEKARPIMFYKFHKTEAERDEAGNLVFDENGHQKLQSVALEKPVCSVAHVFHVSQLEGDIPVWATPPARDWDTQDRAERMLAGSGVPLIHDQRNRAFYSPMKDEIHLPDRGQFADAASYYAVALHELGHATGHESRLARGFTGMFGDPEYAREELRAEIGSFMLSLELGLDYNPDQHQGYVNNWIEVLRKDPYEIVRACRDAEKIKEMVMGFEHVQVQTQDAKQEARQTPAPGSEPERLAAYAPPPAREVPQQEAKDSVYLAVPYIERQAAKKAGARWDADAKSWYAPAGTDLTSLTRWLPEKQAARQTALETLSPQEEFARVLAEAGLDLRGEMPLMDGQLHRVALLDRPQGKDAAYVGHADGLPAGYCQNFVSGEKRNWKYSGQTLSDAQKAELRQERDQRRQERERDRLAIQDQVAKQVAATFAERRDASPVHPYLMAKGVQAYGIKESLDAGTLLIPLRNADGELRSLQLIEADGRKTFLRGGQKGGCFHAIGAFAEQGPILLAEGYATGASLHQATGQPVAVCFDSGNLLSVARALREKFPQAAITICADNDHHLLANARIKQNVGVSKAKEAALAVGAKLAVPNFSPEEKKAGLKDFNDLHLARGGEAVIQALQRGQFQGKRQDQSKDKELAR